MKYKIQCSTSLPLNTNLQIIQCNTVLRTRNIVPIFYGETYPNGLCERLDWQHPPFFYVGVDCFGPFSVNYGRSSVKYCLIKLINEEHSFSMMSDKVERTSFYSFKVFIKHRVFDTYTCTCEIVECKACAIINIVD